MEQDKAHPVSVEDIEVKVRGEQRAEEKKQLRAMSKLRKVKKKKAKQLTLKQALKNSNKPEVNFQGFPLEKCTYSEELEKHLFVHPSYDKAWKKRQKEAHYFPTKADTRHCPHCFFKPCSARLFETTLEEACTIEQLCRFTEEEHKEKLCFVYRAQLMKIQGKRFMNKQMNSNNDIPVCAKRLASKIASVEAGGYDSLLDFDNPLSKQRVDGRATDPFGGYCSSAEEEACF